MILTSTAGHAPAAAGTVLTAQSGAMLSRVLMPPSLPCVGTASPAASGNEQRRARAAAGKIIAGARSLIRVRERELRAEAAALRATAAAASASQLNASETSSQPASLAVAGSPAPSHAALAKVQPWVLEVLVLAL